MSKNIKIIDGEEWYRRRYVQFYGGMMAMIGAAGGFLLGVGLP